MIEISLALQITFTFCLLLLRSSLQLENSSLRTDLEHCQQHLKRVERRAVEREHAVEHLEEQIAFKTQVAEALEAEVKQLRSSVMQIAKTWNTNSK